MQGPVIEFKRSGVGVGVEFGIEIGIAGFCRVEVVGVGVGSGCFGGTDAEGLERAGLGIIRCGEKGFYKIDFARSRVLEIPRNFYYFFGDFPAQNVEKVQNASGAESRQYKARGPSAW
jgi:hypothetical protein